jgi:hypothetical protein
MYCRRCGAVLGQDANFCPSCGRPPAAVPLPIVSTANAVQVSEQDARPRQRPRPKTPWLIAGGIILGAMVVIIARRASDSSATQNPTPSAVSQPKIARPSIPPPTYRIYKLKTDEPTSVVVPVNTTNEQLRSLLWFFREKVRSRQFKDIGLTQATTKQRRSAKYLSGMLCVYRGEKCANEIYIDTNGPCEYGEHDDAYYQWGIEADPKKDSGGIRVNGDLDVVFNYDDGS